MSTRAFLRRELDGVGDDAAEHLVQPLRIAVDRRHPVGHVLADGDVLGPGRRQRGADDAVHQVRHRHDLRLDLELAGDDARDVEDVLDQLRLRLGVAADDVDGLPGAVGRQRAGEQHLHPAEDGVERRAQLVRQRREEIVLQPARLFGRGQAGVLGLLARGDDQTDAAHADGAAVLLLDVALALDPAFAAVRGDDAVLDVVRRPVGDGAAQRVHHPRAIVRMDVPLVAGEGGVEGARRHAVQALDVLRPVHRLPRQVPVPRAERGGVEQVAEVRLAAARLDFGAGPLDGEGDVRRDHAWPAAARRRSASAARPGRP